MPTPALIPVSPSLLIPVGVRRRETKLWCVYLRIVGRLDPCGEEGFQIFGNKKKGHEGTIIKMHAMCHRQGLQLEERLGKE